jgi:hypothetical protein
VGSSSTDFCKLVIDKNVAYATRAYHVYVNCRPLLRRFMAYKNTELSLDANLIPAYFAGRFDGDGSVGSDFYCDCRIVYGTQSEAERDLRFAEQLGFGKCKIYTYKKVKTFCLYFSRFETQQFLSEIYEYSVRLQKSVFEPRRDLALKRPDSG